MHNRPEPEHGNNNEEEVNWGHCLHGCRTCGALWECSGGGECSFDGRFDIPCPPCYEQTEEVN